MPEVSMHLITDACPLWKATDADLERLGLPAPYWAFAWSGGQALARHILDHPEEVSSRTVLSFGAGGGVEALAAARAGARRVIASDIDQFAIEALHLNAELNDVDIEATIDDLIGHIDPAWDIVLAADVTYETELTARVIDWLAELQARGVEVRIADPGRGFLNPARLEMLAEYDAPSDIDIDGSDLRVTPVFRLNDE
ncbi:MAG: 50S ribosomal protein L11 methyltransferase [Myxococcota bacterium]